MKSTVVEPTTDNLADSIINDKFKRNSDEIRFLKYLKELEGPYTVALDGKWGTGKTFYVKEANLIMNYLWKKNAEDNDSKVCDELPPDIGNQLKNKLDEISQDIIDLKQYGIYYDAWKNDYQSNPLYSLILTIIEQTKMNIHKSNFDFMKSATGILLILSQFLPGPYSEIIGIGKQLVDMYKKARNDDKEADILNSAKNEKKLNSEIQEFFSQLSEALSGSRIVIFIDELDRCNPQFAVRLLEQLKHYLRHENITFVLSVDTMQLQHTIKKFYGEGYDGSLYIDKMVDDKIFLREIRAKYLLEADGHQSDEYYTILINDLARYFGFSLRVTEKFLDRMRKNILPYYVPHHNNLYVSDENYFCLRFFAPILLALNYGDPNGYNDFVNGNGWEILQNLMMSSKDSYKLLRKSVGPFGNETKWFGTTNDEALDKLHLIYMAVFNDSEWPDSITNGLSFSGDLKDFLLKNIQLEK